MSLWDSALLFETLGSCLLICSSSASQTLIYLCAHSLHIISVLCNYLHTPQLLDVACCFRVTTPRVSKSAVHNKTFRKEETIPTGAMQIMAFIKISPEIGLPLLMARPMCEALQTLSSKLHVFCGGKRRGALWKWARQPLPQRSHANGGLAALHLIYI